MAATNSSRRKVAIFGATSDLSIAVARLYAEAGDRLVLIGRNETALSTLAADLTVRGAAEIAVHIADFARTADLPDVALAAWQRFDGIDIALIAYAVQPTQQDAEQHAAMAEASMVVNFVSPALLLLALAPHFRGRGGGTIGTITSVAGDRGRKNNYIYGAAKGGLNRFLEGLRNSMHGAGVRVVDIRPGFVLTKINAHLNRGGPLWATPERVAPDIVKALRTGRPVLYTPWFWRIIMFVVRNITRPLYHRTSF